MPDLVRVLRPRSFRFTLIALLSVLIVASLSSQSGRAQDHAQEHETSRLLAILFDSGRLVVGMNQQLINDESKGDKGFTSAVFEKQVLKAFEQRTGRGYQREASVEVRDSSFEVPLIGLSSGIPLV
jgi:hypothetical protein